MLSNRHCDTSCNVTACAFDRGACLPQLAAACSPGCQPNWLADGECDDACFNALCGWDAGDCEEIDIEGCARECFADYISDSECDKACNVAECMFDGLDCDHGHSECYEKSDGSDYRGAVNMTASGKPCQRWSSQFPQQHFFTHARYPSAGLGAHAACRNPGSVMADGVWCYTNDHRTRWERCDVGPAAAAGGCTTGEGGGGAVDGKGPPHRPATKARGPSACERLCPRNYFAIVSAGECEAIEDCSDGRGELASAGGGDACGSERGACIARRAVRERLLLVLWLSLSGTSLFVMGLVVHAYRLTSPMGSPRSFAEAGYTGLAFATQGTGIGIPSAHDPSPKGDGADAHHAHLVE